jgi:hypothetical protein
MSSAGTIPHLAILIGKDLLHSLTKGRVIVKRDIPAYSLLKNIS